MKIKVYVTETIEKLHCIEMDVPEVEEDVIEGLNTFVEDIANISNVEEVIYDIVSYLSETVNEDEIDYELDELPEITGYECKVSSIEQC